MTDQNRNKYITPLICIGLIVLTFVSFQQVLKNETLPLIAKKAPSLSLFTSVFIHGINKNLEGYYIYPNGMMDLERATKKT